MLDMSSMLLPKGPFDWEKFFIFHDDSQPVVLVPIIIVDNVLERFLYLAGKWDRKRTLVARNLRRRNEPLYVQLGGILRYIRRGEVVVSPTVKLNDK